MAKGRPSTYSKALVDKICEKISTSEKGLHHICKKNADFPHVGTLMRWLADDDKKYFREQYARAREAQADYMAERLLEIVDDTSKNDIAFTGINHVQRDKLRYDARRWLMSKLFPKKYGDSPQSEPSPEENARGRKEVIFRFEADDDIE